MGTKTKPQRNEQPEQARAAASNACRPRMAHSTDDHGVDYLKRVATPKEEWFDVVNEHDEVVRQATRREVHTTGLWHRAVHVLVFDGTGRVFLQKRSLLKDLSPGLWDSSCSGHLDAGEGYDGAAVRELGEEIGIRIERAPDRWFRLQACAETGWEFVWVYRMRYDGPITIDPLEIQYGEWVAAAEITARMTFRPEDYSPSFMLIWSMAAAKLAGENSQLG